MFLVDQRWFMVKPREACRKGMLVMGIEILTPPETVSARRTRSSVIQLRQRKIEMGKITTLIIELQSSRHQNNEDRRSLRGYGAFIAQAPF